MQFSLKYTSHWWPCFIFLPNLDDDHSFSLSFSRNFQKTNNRVSYYVHKIATEDSKVIPYMFHFCKTY